jgi:filamentous hemagglutinin family protein
MKIRPSTSLGLCLALLGGVAYAQAPPPITSSGLNTQVSAPVNLPGGAVQHNITGGTRPGGGANLFHSFGEFGVPTNNIANFLNDSALPTTNILSRVTGGNPSNILGTIQTQNFGNANLFLMNPAGIVFGPNASLNVGGAAHFTTADYLKLSDGVQFTALPGPQDALLSVAPVAAFGFLVSNPAPITVEGSTLSVSEGQTLSMVGGDITIGSGLNASSGKIAIASVGSPGEVLADTYASAPNVTGQSFTTMGDISLSEGTLLDVSGNAGGAVIIRGGNLMMTNARISADTVDGTPAPVGIDINVSGDMSISSDTDSAITARTTGLSDAGEIHLMTGNLTVTSTVAEQTISTIDSSTLGTGKAGDVTLTTGNLTVNGGDFSSTFIEAGTGGDGNGGHVTIVADNADLSNTAISTGDTVLGGFGSGGNLKIHADSLRTDRVSFSTDSFGTRGGDLTLEASNIIFEGGSFIGVTSVEGGSEVTITADRFVLGDLSVLSNITILGPGGGIRVTANNIELKNSSTIVSDTYGDGDAGGVVLTGRQQISIIDDPAFEHSQPSGVFTNSFGDPDFGTNGHAGSIEIMTPLLTMAGGGRLNSTTQTSGRGGDVTVIAQNVSINGSRIDEVASETFGLGGSRASGIYTRTVGSDLCSGPCGDAGTVRITTGSFNISQGGVLNSGTTNNGAGGSISINASNNISIAGTLEDGTPGGVFSRTTGTDSGSGAGGEISLTSDQNFTLSDGATVSASSDGPGNAGNINITGHDTILIDKATVTTEAAQSSGGNIKLTANDTIQLTDSTIASSVQGDATTVGGNVTLDPDFIILQNSQILAKAKAGQGGNILLTANKAVVLDAQSTLDASSQTGISGSVTIESPIQVLSGTIAPLPDQPVNVATLYAARCVAGEGGHFSTFVDSKSDSVAPTPGTFLASPFLPQVSSSPAGALGHAGTPSRVSGNDQTPPIQLAAYSPPVLFAQGDGMASACP